MATKLPLIAFTDSIPLDYSHAMTGSMLAGGDVAVEFWPYLHDMVASVLAGADTTMQFVGTDYYDMVASMLTGADTTMQFITVTEYAMVASALVGADNAVATATAYEMVAGLKAWADTDMSFPANTMTVTLPAHALDATLFSGPVATLSLSVPAHTVAIEMAWVADNTLAAHTGTGTVDSGNVFNATASVPAHTLAATLSANIFSSAAMTLRAHDLSASGIGYPLLDSTVSATLPAHTVDVTFWAGSYGSADLVSAAAILSASGFSGSVGSASPDALAHTLEASILGEYTMVASLVLLPHVLSATASQNISAAFRAWALNLRKAALTEYTPFVFNSFATFNGEVYAAGSGGIRKLAAQNDDAGTDIDATARTGQHNFGTTFLKRVPRAYLGYKADGDLEFRTITGEDGRRSYLLSYNGNPNIHQRRIPIGRGPKSPYWQFEVVNRAGADFLIDYVLAYSSEVTRRRVM